MDFNRLMFVQNYKSLLSAALVMILFSSTVRALEQDGSGDKSNVASYYLFTENGGATVLDKSISNPLNLSLFGNATWLGSKGISIDLDESGVKSTTNTTEIISQCKASNELTIDLWVNSRTINDSSLAAYGPARIISLSNGVSETAFFVGQGYDGGHFYTAGVNYSETLDNQNRLRVTGPTLATDPDDKNIVLHNTLQHITFTKDKGGVARLFVSDKNQIPVKRVQMILNNADLSSWGTNYTLTLGNSSKFNQDAGLPLLKSLTKNNAFGARTIEDKDWLGQFMMVAVSCKALTEKEVLGSRYPTDWILTSEGNYIIDPNKAITPARTLASVIYQRVAGARIPIDHPILDNMESVLAPNMASTENRMQAASIAANQPGFYNRTVKDFAKRMSTREETVDTPLNDFTAMMIGAVRDNIDATKLLTQDFYYWADPTRAAVPSDIANDILLSNDHFEAVEKQNYDLSSVLVPMKTNVTPSGGQVFYNGRGQIVAASKYDPAGLLTSRAFLSAHSVAGTNRRLVEYTFREFLCQPISQWADNTAPDEFVGRDVDRFPTGDHTKYQTQCRGCHGQMDALRGAFSRVTFETGFVKHAWVVNRDPSSDADEANNNEDMSTVVQVPFGIVGKYNRAATEFPNGRETTDNLWKNFITRGLNATYFRWNENYMTGRGIASFGQMISESGAYPECLTKRVFRSVCNREALTIDSAAISRVAESFKTTDNYNMKKLFERMVAQPECLGQ